MGLLARPALDGRGPQLKAVARSRGWTVKDFRTGRKAAKIGVPTLGVAALSGGLVGGAIALRRRNRWPW